MTISDIRRRPTTLAGIAGPETAYHESCLRAYSIVEKLRDLIEKMTPHDVLLELLDEMHTAPQGSWDIRREHPCHSSL